MEHDTDDTTEYEQELKWSWRNIQKIESIGNKGSCSIHQTYPPSWRSSLGAGQQCRVSRLRLGRQNDIDALRPYTLLRDGQRVGVLAVPIFIVEAGVDGRGPIPFQLRNGKKDIPDDELTFPRSDSVAQLLLLVLLLFRPLLVLRRADHGRQLDGVRGESLLAGEFRRGDRPSPFSGRK